mmetsp:Transcript_45719/g.90036  ORF Transcript_45719/g.90036 Transcript_45719/m.90036 type:complete len:468 (+) Transcript_45719:651-2054(+)
MAGVGDWGLWCVWGCGGLGNAEEAGDLVTGRLSHPSPSSPAERISPPAAPDLCLLPSSCEATFWFFFACAVEMDPDLEELLASSPSRSRSLSVTGGSCWPCPICGGDEAWFGRGGRVPPVGAGAGAAAAAGVWRWTSHGTPQQSWRISAISLRTNLPSCSRAAAFLPLTQDAEITDGRENGNAVSAWTAFLFHGDILSAVLSMFRRGRSSSLQLGAFSFPSVSSTPSPLHSSSALIRQARSTGSIGCSDWSMPRLFHVSSSKLIPSTPRRVPGGGNSSGERRTTDSGASGSSAALELHPFREMPSGGAEGDAAKISDRAREGGGGGGAVRQSSAKRIALDTDRPGAEISFSALTLLLVRRGGGRLFTFFSFSFSFSFSFFVSPSPSSSFAAATAVSFSFSFSFCSFSISVACCSSVGSGAHTSAFWGRTGRTSVLPCASHSLRIFKATSRRNSAKKPSVAPSCRCAA